MTAIVKMTKHKSGPFEYAESMPKGPARSVYLGNMIYYLLYLHILLPKGLEADLKGSNTFPILMLLMHIDRLGLFCYL